MIRAYRLSLSTSVALGLLALVATFVLYLAATLIAALPVMIATAPAADPAFVLGDVLQRFDARLLGCPTIVVEPH